MITAVHHPLRRRMHALLARGAQRRSIRMVALMIAPLRNRTFRRMALKPATGAARTETRFPA